MEWTTAIGRILADILPIIGTALSILLSWAVFKIGQKFQLEQIAGMHELMQGAAEKAIAFAERWAAQQANKPTGSEKMDQALVFVEGIVGQKAVQQYGSQQLKKLVESLLHIQEESK